MKPTKKQLKVAETFIQIEREKGHRPTYQDIADVLGVASSVVYIHMKKLEKIGYAECRPDGARILIPNNLPEKMKEETTLVIEDTRYIRMETECFQEYVASMEKKVKECEGFVQSATTKESNGSIIVLLVVYIPDSNLLEFSKKGFFTP